MNQVLAEKEVKTTATSRSIINSVLQSTHTLISDRVSKLGLTESQKKTIEAIITESFKQNAIDINEAHTNIKVLVDFNDNEINEFQALFDNIKYSFNTVFKQLVKDIKNNALFLLRRNVRLLNQNMMMGMLILKK